MTQLIPRSTPQRPRSSRRPITRDEYYRMGEVGILKPEERVELIRGDIIPMAPAGPEHSSPITMLNRIFANLVVQHRADVLIQQPITLDETSEPEPDVALVRFRDEGYADHHPYPDDVYLLIEVAKTSQKFDMGDKRELYAAAAIPEYWVLDVPGRVMTVYRQPQPEQADYASAINWPVKKGVTLQPQAFPDADLPLDRLC